VTSDAMPLTEGEQLFVSVPVKVTAGSLSVILYDATNSAAIETVTLDEEQWTEARFQTTVPANCETVTVRLASATASTTAYVNYVQVIPEHAIFDISSLSIADTVNPSDIMGIFTQRTGFSSEATDSYVAFTERLIPWPQQDDIRDYYGTSYIQVTKPCNTPLFVKFRDVGTAFTAINANTSEFTYIPLEVLIEGCLAELKERLRNRTRNGQMVTKYAQEVNEHRRSFQRMLDAQGLGRPEPQWKPARRVSV